MLDCCLVHFGPQIRLHREAVNSLSNVKSLLRFRPHVGRIWRCHSGWLTEALRRVCLLACAAPSPWLKTPYKPQHVSIIRLIGSRDRPKRLEVYALRHQQIPRRSGGVPSLDGPTGQRCPSSQNPARSPCCDVGCLERFLLFKEAFDIIPNI